MEIADINLGFLWEERGGPILDAPDPFWEKWREDKGNFREFMKTESISKIVELMVLAYRDKYPRDYWSSNFLNDKIWKSELEADSDGIKTYGKDYMLRKDVISYADKEKIAQGEFEYSSEIMLEFATNHDLETPIERALQGKIYTKNIIGSQTTYVVENSPLAQIEITDRSFKLLINKDYYVYLGY